MTLKSLFSFYLQQKQTGSQLLPLLILQQAIQTRQISDRSE